MSPRTVPLGSIQQIPTGVEARNPVDFLPTDRAHTSQFLMPTSVRLGYSRLDKPSNTRVQRFLKKTPLLSGSPMIRPFRKTARAVDRRQGNPPSPTSTRRRTCAYWREWTKTSASCQT